MNLALAYAQYLKLDIEEFMLRLEMRVRDEQAEYERIAEAWK